SVRPTDNHTRTFDGTGIIGPPERRGPDGAPCYPLQRRHEHDRPRLLQFRLDLRHATAASHYSPILSRRPPESASAARPWPQMADRPDRASATETVGSR